MGAIRPHPRLTMNIPTDEGGAAMNLEDRSMRVIEYAMALVALATVGILALLR